MGRDAHHANHLISRPSPNSPSAPWDLGPGDPATPCLRESISAKPTIGEVLGLPAARNETRTEPERRPPWASSSEYGLTTVRTIFVADYLREAALRREDLDWNIHWPPPERDVKGGDAFA